MASVLVMVPSFEGRLKSLTAQSLCNMDWYVDDLEFRFVQGYDVARARRRMAQEALDGRFDYLMMVDSDMVVPGDALERLRGCDANVAMGWAVRGSSDDGLTSVIRPGTTGYHASYYAREIAAMAEPFEVKGNGMCCALIRTEVFRRVKKPWFEYHENPDGSMLGEDYWFCQRCREAGIKLYVDPRVGCGHIHDRVLEAR